MIGGGVVGGNAIMMALGMGADVTVLDRNVDVLRRLVRIFGPALKTVYSTRAALENVTLPYAFALAERGARKALLDMITERP